MTDVEETIGKKVAKGAVWTVGMRLSVRLFGLVNVAILARLLTKADFGLIVLMISVSALLALMLEVLIRVSLIRIQNIRDEHYGAAFKLRFIGGFIAAALIYISAGFVADFYSEPGLKFALQIFAAALVLEGLASPFVVSFQRELEFHKDFIFETIVGIGRIAITIALAFWLRNFFAVAWGIFASAIIKVILSHIMCWGRKIRTDKKAQTEIWNVSKWAIIESFAGFAEERLDRLSLAKLGAVSQLGVFSTVIDLVMLPVGNLILPIGRAFLPGLHKLRERGDSEITEAYAKALGAMIALCFPIAFGIALVADPLVLTLLSDSWQEAVIVVQLAAPMALAEGIYASLNQVYFAEGQLKKITALRWARVFVYVPLVLAGFTYYGINGAAAAKSIAATFMLIPAFWMMIRFVKLDWPMVLAPVGRSLMASVIMALSYIYVTDIIFSLVMESWAQLIIGAAFGGLIYAGSLFTIWHLAKRPDGWEQRLFSMLKIA